MSTSSPRSSFSFVSFRYAITHVFFPVVLPNKNDYTLENDLSLASAVCAATHAYCAYLHGTSEGAQWQRIRDMLDNLQTSVHHELDYENVISQLCDMRKGDILTFYLRPRNTGVVLTKRENSVLCESFELPPSRDIVEKTPDPLICSYPCSAVEIPSVAFDNEDMQIELADFLSRCDVVDSNVSPQTGPQFVATLLTRTFQGASRTGEVPRVTKRVRDDTSSMRPIAWRRSSLWLHIRVAMQMSLDRSPFGRSSYKRFILFFICSLARDGNVAHLVDDLVHMMACKILRRLRKIESSTPYWLSEMALRICASLGTRWNEPPRTQPSPFQNPSQDELARDTRLSLLNSREYISNVLTYPGHNRVIPFHPSHRCRGTIEDFLSSHGTLFQAAYDADPDLTLYDVERSVEHGIDDWVAGVVDVDEACAQLEILMDQYISHAEQRFLGNVETISITVLTALELFVALDKLAVKEMPILVDYSPEISTDFLHRLFLYKTNSLHRLSCAYRYLAARQSQSCPEWSVFSHEITTDSFPVRYYDKTPHLQHLKARIEQDTMQNISGPSQSPLPSSLVQAKAVVFELQCPISFRVWRSAASRILYGFSDISDQFRHVAAESNLLARVPALQPYFVGRNGPNLAVQIHPVYFHADRDPTLCYAVECPDRRRGSQGIGQPLLLWRRSKRYTWFPFKEEDEGRHMPTLRSKSCTSNSVLADQASCPNDLSLDEFIASDHLWSSGAILWLNILQGLRSRTLNLHRRQVRFHLAQVVLQVGPFDLNTGAWVWHQELQDASFCNALLDELDSLLLDIGVSTIDGGLMNSISLLLTRVLASSPGDDVSERVITLLRDVRRMAFKWVEELSYNLIMEPTNEERSQFLCHMAAACRTTFDVDTALLCKLCHSAEDVDTLLSCHLFVRAFKNIYIDDDDLEMRDRRLSIAFEGIMRDVIRSDPSDYGIDLAVARIFATYQPGARRWEESQQPNSDWLTYKTEATMNRPSQTIHLNLLGGDLQVDGLLVGELPPTIRYSLEFERIFNDRIFFVMPSNLPGMDFMAQLSMSKYSVHFSLRDEDLVLQAQCTRTGEILHLIPSDKLQGDLPDALVQDHIHWLNLSTRIVEIRPLAQLWEESPENWKIHCASGEFLAFKGQDVALVDVQSPTWATVSKYFGSFSNVDSKIKSESLLITASYITPPGCVPVLQLSVALPRYGLSFFVNEGGELESCDFNDMVYDENQIIGTLFDFSANKLVLRQKKHIAGKATPEELIHRCVLIPNTKEKYADLFHKELFFTYNVDPELCCLIGDGTLPSTEFLAYVHVKTGCHMPDPLTGKTGAQSALCLVQSAGFKSMMNGKASGRLINFLRSTQYLQIVDAYEETQNYPRRTTNQHEAVTPQRRRARQRASYLFSWNTTSPSPSPISSQHTPWPVTLDQLFYDRQVPLLPSRTQLPRENRARSSNDLHELNQLFSSLLINKSDPSFQQEYITLLENSAKYACEESGTIYSLAGKDRINVLEKHYVQSRSQYFGALDALKESLGPANALERALEQFGQWPPITADYLLRCLASTSPIKLSPHWKTCLTTLALLLLDLQRARRLLRLALDGLEEDFSKELENEGCDGWNADDYPDWLLIQVQGNFLIRRTQAETAMEMISPRSGKNTVMQVNMGEGKSSVIIPIAAAAVANGKQLVRVIVPKPLTVQLFDSLVARLGWMANRSIYHLPFSRSGQNDKMPDPHMLMPRCLAEHGILLVQPEHVMSLKLTNVEKQIHKDEFAVVSSTQRQTTYEQVMTAISRISLPEDTVTGQIYKWLRRSRNNNEIASSRAGHRDGHFLAVRGDASEWQSPLKWIHSNARDILDECDEILHARFQLVYTIGLEKHLDGYPERWTITQQILRLVKEHIPSLSKYHSNSIEYECGPPGSFPYVYIVRGSDIGRRLILLIVEDVMAGRLPIFNFQDASAELQGAIRSFISDEDVLQIPDTVKRVEEFAKGHYEGCLWSGLLLLRGLLACKILLFALSERRWRVDYGLDPQSRHRDHIQHESAATMLAIPYRAKDLPAPNTQFGHPDITIILTCLSHYYTGLTEEQLRVSFQLLLDQGDPSVEYAHWVKKDDLKSLPDSLQKLSEINLRSSEEWDKVTFPLFSRNQGAIDFYLSRVVFPKRAKEFPWKLSASSWDLAEEREKLVTGFSGTNDGQWLLPMSIAQRALNHQQGTNARVLAHLLRPENDTYMVTHDNGERRSTIDFLRMVATQKPLIRVLLDVGAQILDFSNRKAAEAWLGIDRDAAAAIYFDDNDKLMVLLRNGIVQPMSSSPFSQQLERCVVYLDHAHTRGTDLKLPVGSRAAVTLGPRLTKDSLVQGCMRMRKLGCGHSVMFFAPPEVDQSIRSVAASEQPNARVTTVDILRWAIHETWIEIRQRAPFWAQQGMSHKSRYEACSRFCDGQLTAEKLADAWLQLDTKSLAELYGPSDVNNAPSSLSALDPGIRQRCKTLGVLSLPSAQLEEEQEREVNRERERERDVELPPKAKPAEHTLHPDVIKFVNTGDIPLLHAGSAFRPIFTTLGKSSAAAVTREADVWSPFILATVDFCNVIDPESTRGTIDQYLRPVQWVLTRNRKDRRDQVLVLLSPFEADLLMPDIRVSKHVHLHVYASRTSQRMKPSDDLKLFVIPPLPSDWTPPWDLIDQLNVFSGQLYLRDYASYLRLCSFLCVAPKESLNDKSIRRNFFKIPGSFEEHEIVFSSSPLPSVMALLAMRSRGRPFVDTHMGKILQGLVLTEKDFEVAEHHPARYDMQGSHAVTSAKMLPSTWDMTECDAQRSSSSLNSSKRVLDVADVGFEPLQKRLRADWR